MPKKKHTPPHEIEDWLKREEIELKSVTIPEFKTRLKDYFEEAGKRPPTGEEKKSVIHVATKLWKLEKVGLIQRIVTGIRKFLRL